MRKLLIGLLLVSLIVTGIIGSFAYRLFFTPVSPPAPLEYQLAAGASLSKVAADLHAAGILRTPLSLKFFALLNKQSGQIQTGRYVFKAAATPEEILHRLVSGDVEKVSLTIPEGFSQEQIFARIDELGFGNRRQLKKLSSDKEFIHSLGIDASSLEGYLYPETYVFTPGINERKLLRMMTTQFRRKVTPDLITKAKTLKLNLHQLVTLASIIEKETGKVEEMALISSVFHNRLARGIQLQTDPTVIYGIDNFDGNLTRKHLKTKTPYNTYMIRGLPPGPIASPGLAALQAAATPAKSKYLYFVAKGDGFHQFSKTLKEHNQAVRNYQLKRRR